MERKRSQQQKMKEQQRFCVSQQDLTEALAQMKPTMDNLLQRSRSTHENLSALMSSSSNEPLKTRSVSQLIKAFEARANLPTPPYASAQDLLPIVNDVLANGVASNCSHMSIQTMKSKDNTSDNDITNNNVCSPISFFLTDDNQMVTEDLHQQKVIDDKEQEKIDVKEEVAAGEGKGEEKAYQTLDNDRHKQDLLSSSFYNHHHRTQMLTRSTDIDAAALTLGKRHEIRFDELLTKEAQLNHALADLISISNDVDKSSSITLPLKIHIDHQQQQISHTKKNNSISASIELLNNLLQTFELHDEQKQTNKKKNEDVKPINMFCLMLSDNVCANCQQSFATNEQIVNAAGHLWHTQCFVCTQCFQPFENGIYFEHENRKYCEKDFQMLFAPCCAECKKAIVGRVIRALQKCFHPDCFRCQLCQISLLETGFSKYNGSALCRDCHTKEKAKELNLSQHICSQCYQIIDSNSLKFKGEYYHPYHFRCTSCGAELDDSSREIQGSLYCFPCSNKVDLPICTACHRFIDDRVVYALGKPWHVEHFTCAHCAKPFCGNKHFENQGLAYCETDYHLLFGSVCFICNKILANGAYTACNKKYCFEHFTCSFCEKQMNEKSKFFDVDARPVCKHCYKKFPSKIRKRTRFLSPMKQTSV